MKTFERVAADRRLFGALVFVLALPLLRTSVHSSDPQDNSLAVLRNWAQSKNIKQLAVEVLRFDPITRSYQAATEDGDHLIGVCCVRLPQIVDPAQKLLIETAYKEQSRLVATVEAMSLVARPIVEQWNVEPGEFSDRLTAFAVKKKLLTTMPPEVITHVGIAEGWACSYVRSPRPSEATKDLLDGLNKDAMLRDFSAWAADQGIAAASRQSCREALFLFALAHKADAHNSTYLDYALRCFAALGQMDEFDVIVRTILQDPRYPARVYLDCGRVCHEQGRLEDAIQLYAHIADGSPERPAADAAMASAYVAIQQRTVSPATAPTPADTTTQPASAPDGAR